MKLFKPTLVVFTVLIYSLTIIAVIQYGANWPAVFLSDLVAGDWRSQFDADFFMHLLLLATWVSWREGFTAKGYIFGFLSIVMGGMFGFPYLIVAMTKAGGDLQRFFMGVNVKV